MRIAGLETKSFFVDRIGIEIELKDVFGGHEAGRNRARHQMVVKASGAKVD